MSRTMTSASWPSSNRTSRTSVGSLRRPAVISSYMRATRCGVSRTPTRSRSSPIPSRISRTLRSTLAWSNARPPVATVAASSASEPTSALPSPWMLMDITSQRLQRRRAREASPGPSGAPSVGGRAVLGPGDAGLVAGTAAVGADLALGRGHDAPRRPLDHRGEDLGQLLLADGLLLHQRLDHGVGHVPVGGQDLLGLQVRLVDQAAHLLVDLEGDLLGVVLLVTEVAAEEDVLLLGAENQRAEPVAHAVLADHLAGDLGGPLDVVGGAGGRVQEPQLLGDPPAQQHGQLVDHLAAGDQELVLERQAERPAERPPAGDHRDLVDRVGVG